MLGHLKKESSSGHIAVMPEQQGINKLPTEIMLNIVRRLPPTEAINLEAVSHANRELIANNPELWMQHGLLPPILVGEAQTLKQVWLARAKTLPPEIQQGLSTLFRPVDIFSESGLAAFSDAVESMHQRRRNAEICAGRGHVDEMEKHLTVAVEHAATAGIDTPVFLNADVMRAAYIKHAGYCMECAEEYARSSNRFYGSNLERMLERAAGSLKKAGIKDMSTLLVDIIHPTQRPVYEKLMQRLNEDLRR